MTQLSAILILVVLPFKLCFADELPHPGPRSEEQATFLFNEATAAQKDGKTELAIEDYKKILLTYPSFKEKFVVYQQLMNLYLAEKKYPSVLGLGKEALLQHPSSGIYAAIQLMRIDAQLRSGNPLQSKMIVDELLKTKPDTNTVSSALIYKAEALSQLGKHKEAFASLDAAKGNSNYPDAELKIRARACSAKKRAEKEETLDYYHEKNLCFKEAAALAKSSPAKIASQIWCDSFHALETELKKSKTDEFTRKKLEDEFENAKAFSATWGCTWAL